MIGSSVVIGAGNIWLELRNRGCISLQRESAENSRSDGAAGNLDTGDVVVFS
jgi:hypothetical protein